MSHPRPLVVVGAGGFGRELLCLIRDLSEASGAWEFVGFLDDFAPDLRLLTTLGTTHLGPRAAIRELSNDVAFLVGIGNGDARREISVQLMSWGYEPATVVHPTAFVGPDVTLGSGSVVAAGAAVTTNVTAGSFVHVDRAAQVGHDCVLGDFVTINPAAVVSGGVRLGDGVNLGTNSTVLPRLAVAAGVVVGAGAVVTRDVEREGAVVAGVPARELR